MTKTAKVWLIVGVVAAVILCCCVVSAVIGFGIVSSVFNLEEIIVVSASPGSPYVTLANYNRVEVGMTYQEVAAIFGGPGVRTAQIKVGGEWLEFYSWKSTGSSSATIMFKEETVVNKSQSMLR